MTIYHADIYTFDDSGQINDLLYFVSGKQYKGLNMNDIEKGEQIYSRR